jgi:hypothetical protein
MRARTHAAMRQEARHVACACFIERHCSRPREKLGGAHLSRLRPLLRGHPRTALPAVTAENLCVYPQ